VRSGCLLGMLIPLTALLLSGTPNLPLKKIVLYENGVGYFERKGNVVKGSAAVIPLDLGQLDDALKSLVIVSESGVASIEYAPPVSVDAAGALAGLNSDEPPNIESLLRALKGNEVEVTVAKQASLTGKIIDVSEESGGVDKEGRSIIEHTLLLFGPLGLSRINLETVVNVRPTSKSVSLAWNRAVESTSLKPTGDQLKVRANQAGGQITVGYTTEAPVWRTTYRLIVGKKSRLQGFALVHNDSDENWNGVSVSLASGQPTSFIFPLAGPRYSRRELVNTEDGLENAPQLSMNETRIHLGGAPEMTYGGSGVGGSVGYGTGIGTLGSGSGHGTAGSSSVISQIAESSDFAEGPTPLEPAAVSEVGNLFLYSVKEPVTLDARRSALLPIIDEPTQSEEVTLLDAAGTVTTGVRVLNSTHSTLEGGTFAVFKEGAYLGETQIDRIKPNEVRVLKHGADLDVELSRSTDRQEGDVKKTYITGAKTNRVLSLTRIHKVVHHLSLSSKSNRDKMLLVELPEQGYKLQNGIEDVRSPGQPRYARVSLKAHAESMVELIEEGAFTERLSANQLSSVALSGVLSSNISADTKTLIQKLKIEVDKKEQSQVRLSILDSDLKTLERDVIQTRENLVAMGKGNVKQGSEREAQRLIELEKKIESVRKQMEAERQVAMGIESKLLLAEK
jgi:hypothetical protein